MVLPVGTVISNRYEVLEKLGSGGMAIAYRALDKKLERFVTIKVLREEYAGNDDFKTKFKIEARSAASLSHPNIVNVYDVGEEEDIYYIVMEYVHGDTLKRAILQKAPFDSLTTISVAIQIAAALSHAHKNHVVHRDIKPQNILVATDGTIKVTDFGIARAATTATMTTTANAIGSVHYFSPEQARGGYVDEKSDIYSLGITMYEMATGKLPFDGETSVSIALKHLNDKLPEIKQYNPEITRSLEGIIRKATQKKSDERYQSIDLLLADLKKALTDTTGSFIKKSEKIEKMEDPTVQISKEEMDSIQSDRRERISLPLEEFEQTQAPPKEEIKVEIANNRRRIQDSPPVQEDFETRRRKFQISKDDDYEIDEEYENDDYEYDYESMEEPELFDDDDDYYRNSKKQERRVVIAAIFTALIIIGAISAVGLKLLKAEPNTQVSAPTESVAPSFIGLTYEQAQEKAKDYQVEIEKFAEKNSNTYDEGIVMEQTVSEGSKVAKEEKVGLTISKGMASFDMPKVVDIEEKQAKKEIYDLLDVEPQIEYEYDDLVPVGIVMKQQPEAGTKINRDSTIILVVSKGEELKNIIVPKVEEMTLSQARKTLEDSGLVVGSVSETESEKVEKGRVITQTIPAGDEAVKNSVVNLVVSSGKPEKEEPEKEEPKEEEPEKKTPDTSDKPETPEQTPNTGENVTVESPIGSESTISSITLPINRPIMQDDSTSVKVTVIQIGEGGTKTTLVDETRNLTDFPFNIVASGSGKAEIQLYINDNYVWSESVNFSEGGN